MNVVREISKAIGDTIFPDCKIFVLSADSDRYLALEMIKMFRRKGIRCWDNDCILAGQVHNIEQEKAIFDADFVIVIFSAGSRVQEGRYQVLLGTAYQAQLEKQEGAIKLISVLIDECELPYEYRKYLPLDLTSPGNAEKLVQAMEIEYDRRSRLGVKTRKPQAFWR